METLENHKLDNEKQVFFYEQDYYVLSNFSAFRLKWRDIDFDTSEHAYHWEKFSEEHWIQEYIKRAQSAHEAFKIAESHKEFRRKDWDDIKVDIMREILEAKARQHTYVKKKLLDTGDRDLIEDSWRDDFWGWGPNKDGKNMLGKLWMEVREKLQKEIILFQTDIVITDTPNVRKMQRLLISDDPKIAATAEDAVTEFIGRAMAKKWKEIIKNG